MKNIISIQNHVNCMNLECSLPSILKYELNWKKPTYRISNSGKFLNWKSFQFKKNQVPETRLDKTRPVYLSRRLHLRCNEFKIIFISIITIPFTFKWYGLVRDTKSAERV